MRARARRRAVAGRAAGQRLCTARGRPPGAAGRRRGRDRPAGHLAGRAARRRPRPSCSASATPATPPGAELLTDARVATDDGSAGHHGLVTELLEDELDRDPHAEVYACGPPAMLEAVRALCAVREIPAQLALESGMACGFGACFGCVVPTRGGYLRLCVDGPGARRRAPERCEPEPGMSVDFCGHRARAPDHQRVGHVRRDRRAARVRRRAARALPVLRRSSPRRSRWRPRQGNPPPRLWELAGRADELDRAAQQGTRGLPDRRPAAARRAAGAADRQRDGLQPRRGGRRWSARSRERDEVAALELNVSCPNVETGTGDGRRPARGGAAAGQRSAR